MKSHFVQRIHTLLLALVVAGAVRAAEPDLIYADFEGRDYGEWVATGEAFGPGPAQGTLPHQMPVGGFEGHGLVNSFFKGDDSIGTLVSPDFKISRRYLRFLIGGGYHPGKAGLHLLVEGKLVRQATGPNQRAGGTENLEPMAWEVAEWMGKVAHLEIVDQVKSGWGHINVDHIVFTDRKPATIVHDATREITFQKRYLNLPVKTGGPMRRLSVSIGEAKVREFEIELADAEPDFWAFLDVSAYRGQRALLTVDKLPENSAGLGAVEQGDTLKGAEDLYREKLRPQIHFSTRRGWINDPNGLVYYQGEYHLFYQHNPYGWNWGNMHWGHAVSPDLVHWKELPIALYPKQFGDWAFSGSAVVDAKNAAGFRTGAEAPLVAAYTSTGRGECIAYSNDRGRTWTDYSGNPVVKHQGRDPKLIWHEPSHRWVMAVYDEVENTRNIAFYTSTDLKQWTFRSRIAGFYECPDLFELPVEGETGVRKWVLTAASSEYRVGMFDGERFTPETVLLPGHRGNAFYAAQTFSDLPPADGRRIQVGWSTVKMPGMPFNQMMAFPCELSLRRTPEGVRLCFEPIREIQTLHGAGQQWGPERISAGTKVFAERIPELLDLRAEIRVEDATEVGLRVRGVMLAYHAQREELDCLGVRVRLPLQGGKLRLRLLMDRASVEVFADEGRVYLPLAALPGTGSTALEVFSKSGQPVVQSVGYQELRSVWKTSASGRSP